MQPLARCTVVLSLLTILGAWSAPRLMAQTSTVRCESQGTAMKQCPIPSNAKVVLTRTLSQEACIGHVDDFELAARTKAHLRHRLVTRRRAPGSETTINRALTQQ